MDQIIPYVIKVVLAALAVKLLGLNTKRVVISNQKSISWIWKLMAPMGKFAFFYGMIVFIANLTFGAENTNNIVIGGYMLFFGLIFWIWGASVIHFSKN